MPVTSQPKFHVGAKSLSWELEFLKCDDFHKLITKIAERNCVPASRACFVMLAENWETYWANKAHVNCPLVTKAPVFPQDNNYAKWAQHIPEMFSISLAESKEQINVNNRPTDWMRVLLWEWHDWNLSTETRKPCAWTLLNLKKLMEQIQKAKQN
jgi:hypothetical protein